MKYLYYPGCSCSGKTTGRAYAESLTAVLQDLNVTYEELEDWNCCGATMYMSVDEQQAFAMSARNLALAERQGENGAAAPTLTTPCAACYTILNKTQHYIDEYPKVGKKIHSALAAADLSYRGKVEVRHPLDIMVNDIGLEEIASRVKQPLKGVKVASYYGCLLVRPYATFDDQDNPTTMDRLMAALGAEPVDWSLKTRCCGASLSGTMADVAVRLGYILLSEARRCGADVVATACPFCQFNLECFQQPMIKDHKLAGEIPIAYFTQLTGIALGLPDKALGLHRLSVPLSISDKIGEQEYA